MKLIHVTLALCCLAAAVPAQVGDSSREKIRRKVDAMRTAMREGKIRHYNVYVKVRLKNGNRLRGVVKNGKFVELSDGIDFVSAAQVNDKRAGMRVWYTAGSNSYVFLRYEEIERYTIGSRLTDDQVKSIEHTLEKKLAETKENYRRLRQASQDSSRSGEPLKGGTGNPVGKKIPELTEEQAKLLKEFPATDGWGKAKLDRLKSRRITLGVYPNKKELRFEEVYAKWAEAFDAQQAIEKAKAEAAEEARVAAQRRAAAQGSSKQPTPAESPSSGTTGGTGGQQNTGTPGPEITGGKPGK